MFMENAIVNPKGHATIPVTKGPKLTKSGTQLVCGFIPAGLLIPDNYEVPYRDSTRKTGYQRPPSPPRINELTNDLRLKRTDLPTAVLLNLRAPAAREAVVEHEGGHILDLGALKKRGHGTVFYVVDGQHRLLALEKLIAEDEERWRTFMVPFVCMLGADENEEMDQFYTVNSKAKSVRTDLAYALLKERADRDPDVYDALIERGRQWQVDGQALVERLAESSSPWKRRIRFPGNEKDETTISNTSLVSSLKAPLSDSALFKRSSPDQRVRILDAYWQGIRLIMPEAFEDAGGYSIQKGIGAGIMHEILPDVLELVRSNGSSVLEPESYREVLEPAMEKLEGDTAEGDVVKGNDFWRSGAEGASGSFSSAAGQRVLSMKLRQLLPNIEVE